jgi:membrane-bound metal-dependent hydrolase YbcI (DUF457 family)
MWFLGHFALGYFSALGVSKFTKEKINIPLVWFISILPDIDFFFEPLIIHRGPTHSIVIAALAFLPIFLIYRRGLPYFAALLSHSLIGDFLVPPVQLLWPIDMSWYGINSSLKLTGIMETMLEISLFALMIIFIIISELPTSKARERGGLPDSPR